MATYNAFAKPNAPKKYQVPTVTVNSYGSNSYSGSQIPASSYYSNKASQTSTPTSVNTGFSPGKPGNTSTGATNPFSTQLSSYNSASNDYLKRMQELAGQANTNLTNQRAGNEARINQQYDRVNAYYNDMIPSLQGRFDQYRNDANASLEQMRQATDRSKTSTRDQYLGAQRDALIADRNNRAALDQKHAASGTVDSSFYKNDNANRIADQNRYRQMNNAEMANRLADMDAELATAERQAQQAIMQEQANLEDAARNINFQLGNNEDARQQALAELVASFDNNVNAIQNSLADLEFNLANQKYEFETSLATQQDNSLSGLFMATGIPQTEADYRYQIENAGNYAKLNQTTNTKLSDKQIIAQNGLNAISQIQNYLTNSQGINKNPFNGVTDEGRNYQAAINNAADWIGRLRSGGAINQDESERFLGLLPTFWDSQQVAQNKLNTLAGEFETALGSAGSSLDQNQLNDILQTIGYM